ncbi:MAG TPA: hypothetical protein VJ652_15085 [Noviherbaspirillum sp.]|nr:hypothetical protein [Noviherbaspirillum sp.]
MLGTVQKQPADQLDYDIDFERWLTDSDTITTATAAVSGADDFLTLQSVQVASPKVKVWLAGGSDGVTYTITVTTSTAGGRIKEEEFKLRVKEI